jgi:excinuclease ABC subunit C
MSLLQEKLTHLPTSPGVYQHKDATGKVIYVGKAKNLRNRVRSYFQQGRNHDGRIQALVSKIADIEIIITDTEAEALILENNLIKQLQPRYNINLRDDKTYPYICIKNERFPRIFPTRRIQRDGSKYFGPYTDVKSMNIMLETIRSVFQLRSCNLSLTESNIRANKFQPCLDFHIKKCAAPCVGLQSESDYNESIEQIKQLLNGKTTALLASLKQQMLDLAKDKRFEAAAALRDRIRALEQFSSKQKIVTEAPTDRDLFAISIDQDINAACGVLFKVREGKIIGRQHKYMTQITDFSESALIQTFVEHYYSDAVFFPDEIFLSHDVEDAEALLALLWQQKGKKVPIHTPQRGEKADLMRMVEANSQLLLDEYKVAKAQDKEDAIPRTLRSLQRDLRLPRLPRHIECFDISHLSGTGTVASCVVFVDAKPAKSQYRKFKIVSAEGKPDDFMSMHEVITRRYSRVMEEDRPIPDLIIIDGGKGQLSHAIEAMNEIGFYGKAPVVSLAKRLEEVFFPNDTDSLIIPRTSSSLRLLQQVRDEAHRFAVTAQREQRKIKDLHSELMDIEGVGAVSVQKLLKHFGSVKKVRDASEEALIPVVGKAVAKKVQAWRKTEQS